ncbi:MAG: ABC transporter substrate-binding protein [Acidobacteria bacterium]|nr:ABC transporter substrate-binding protein [Acidobacteriota bacterium]
MIENDFVSSQKLTPDPLLNLILKGTYKIEEKIGQGATGSIYRATQLETSHNVAVKILRATDISLQAKARFFREAKALSKLDHPNIISLFDYGVTETDICFMVMEYAVGLTIDQIVPKESGLPVKVILNIMEKLCSGIEAAHKQKIIHRDLKPSNVLITNTTSKTQDVKILDFGIAKSLEGFIDENPRLTKEGVVLGTPSYVSPEQIDQLKDIDCRADIYALGAILYYMFTGGDPYVGKTSEIINKQIREPITNKSARFKTIEGQVFSPILSKAMSIKRENRYQTVEELFNDLSQGCLQAGLLKDSKADPSKKPKPTQPLDINSLLLAEDGFSNTNPLTNDLKQEEAQNMSFTRKNRFVSVGILLTILLAFAISILLYLNRTTPPDALSNNNLPSQSSSSNGGQQGVTDTEILMGMSAAFSGSAKELGRQMKLGIDTYFNEINSGGGINGRKINLISLDDGYEPDRALQSVKELVENRKVFGIIGNVGTPTAEITVPYCLEKKTLFFGAFTGASLLRKDPPDKYVFNYRASYAEETAYIVEYLVDIKKLRPSEIAVFAQNDSYGDAGFSGVVKAMQKYKYSKSQILRVGYNRNTLDIEEAVNTVSKNRSKLKAVVMVCTYKVGAKFIQQLKDQGSTLIFTNVSFVGSNALSEELMSLGPKYANGVIVTQVVPHYESNAATIIKYREQLKKYFPNEEPGFVSLEGYLAARIFCDAISVTGKKVTTDNLISSLESIRDLDIGIGSIINFGPSEHQGSHKIWATVLDDKGKYKDLDN